MELRFVNPELTSLDELDTEILACSVWSDARPVHGVAGLCDWRLSGGLSTLLRSGFVTGTPGEVVMVPGKPRLAFDKILFFGAGPRAAFDEDAFRRVTLHMLNVMEGLCARVAVVELPGRHDGLIAAERAADILLASAGRKREHDVWTLVEGADARQRITQHMIEERRRVRRVL
ncbi:M17 family peptidase N-terminal domain-containing protein [Polyangium aurulentum]|uniref:M17 family peptidase N-terminal domain-containing protein n=1 Tax=Polyangium aurulentum TaxID=2567896 RepID=UPI0010AE5447|nr:M17 family peptidase N-terminal domain-containing protein [Polyangium aurulentum]UQA61606.1 leucyl aminopeptidase [Polyangium aurulentum]